MCSLQRPRRCWGHACLSICRLAMFIADGYFDYTASMMLSLLQEHGENEVVESSNSADVILIPELFGNEANIAPLVGNFLKVMFCCLLDRRWPRRPLPWIYWAL